MKVLFVHNYYQQPGGEDVALQEEITAAELNGFETHLYTANNDNIKTVLDKIKTMILCFYNPFQKWNIEREILKFKPDIVHVHNFFPVISPSVFDACAKHGVPVVMTLHNYRILCPTGLLYHDEKLRERSIHASCWWTVPRKVYKDSYVGTFATAGMIELHKAINTWGSKVDRLIALTDFAKRKFIQGGLPGSKLVVKGHAVRDRLPQCVDPDAPRTGALFVGRLSQEKGLGVLVEAWRRLDTRLSIVGDGPLADWVRVNAPAKVAMLGRLPPMEVAAEMRRASFLVMPSVWYEMFGIVILEAFSQGLPVLASDIAGVSELVVEGVTGLRFRANDAEDLAEKVRWAAAHKDEMARMGRAARERYEELYRPEQNAAKLAEIYKAVIAERALSA